MTTLPQAVVQLAIQQLHPGLSMVECSAWVDWVSQQSNYFITTVHEAGCIAKVYDQADPPWLRVAHEVAWWGHGRDAVRSLHRAIDWARLQGATMFGYSLLPHLDVVKWKKL